MDGKSYEGTGNCRKWYLCYSSLVRVNNILTSEMQGRPPREMIEPYTKITSITITSSYLIVLVSSSMTSRQEVNGCTSDYGYCNLIYLDGAKVREDTGRQLFMVLVIW